MRGSQSLAKTVMFSRNDCYIWVRLHLHPLQSWGYRLNVMFVWSRRSLLHVGSGTPIVKSIAVGCLRCFMQDWVMPYCHYAQCFPACTNTPHVRHIVCVLYADRHICKRCFITLDPAETSQSPPHASSHIQNSWREVN